MREGGRKKVTMNDIAEHLQISNVTVSNALSGKKGVSQIVRDEIFRVADELSYVYRKSSAKPESELMTGYDIGIMTAQRYLQIGSSFYWEMYQMLAVELKQQGLYSIFDILSDEDEASLTIS